MSTSTTQKVINLQQAVEGLIKITEEVGSDYAYVRQPKSELSCLYWHPGNGNDGAAARSAEDINAGQPGCIVGRFLHDQGLDSEQIASLDGRGAVQNLEVTLGGYDVRLTAAATRFLSVVQTKQDRGWTWTAAVAYGRGFIEAARDQVRPGNDW